MREEKAAYASQRELHAHGDDDQSHESTHQSGTAQEDHPDALTDTQRWLSPVQRDGTLEGSRFLKE
jgi:hypothetical protein